MSSVLNGKTLLWLYVSKSTVKTSPQGNKQAHFSGMAQPSVFLTIKNKVLEKNE